MNVTSKLQGEAILIDGSRAEPIFLQRKVDIVNFAEFLEKVRLLVLHKRVSLNISNRKSLKKSGLVICRTSG